MKCQTRDGLIGSTVATMVSLGLLLAGCATSPAGAGSTQTAKVSGQSGAQLWAQNCGHCHNIRSPGSGSDTQWDVVVMHMRVRGNLTADEHKQILAFLKSAH